MRNITMAQIKVVPGRPDINCQTMLDAIATAKGQGGKIIIFPSMALTSSLLGDTWQYEHFAADAKKYGQKIIAASDGITVIYGNVAGSRKTKLYIAAFVAQNGRLIGGKAEYDGAVAVQRNLNWLDKRYFTPAAEEPQPVEITIDGKKHSFVFLMGEDILLTPKSTKVDFIFYLNNRVFTWSKPNYAVPLWASRMQACLLQVNMVGMQNIGKTVYAMPGGSSVYSPRGEKIKLLPLWRPEIYTLPFTPRTAKTQETEENEWGYFTPGAPKITPIYNAIIFSIREFMQNIGKRRVVIGLSGGIDSAVSACLFTQALGAEHVLLVNLPSRNNSDTTKKCAYQLAEELGCHYTSMPIGDSVAYTGSQINQTVVTNLANGKKKSCI